MHVERQRRRCMKVDLGRLDRREHHLLVQRDVARSHGLVAVLVDASVAQLGGARVERGEGVVRHEGDDQYWSRTSGAAGIAAAAARRPQVARRGRRRRLRAPVVPPPSPRPSRCSRRRATLAAASRPASFRRWRPCASRTPYRHRRAESAGRSARSACVQTASLAQGCSQRREPLNAEDRIAAVERDAALGAIDDVCERHARRYSVALAVGVANEARAIHRFERSRRAELIPSRGRARVAS